MVRLQYPFYLSRSNAVTLVFDHIDGSIHEKKPPILIHTDNIFGSIPDLAMDIDKAIGRLFGFIPILLYSGFAGAQ
jgi:hypothetical protein